MLDENGAFGFEVEDEVVVGDKVRITRKGQGAETKYHVEVIAKYNALPIL